MFVTDVPQNLLDGFHFRESSEVKRKLIDFLNAGPNKLHLISDFDLTLTAGKQPGHNLGTWDVMDALIPPEGVVRHTAIYQSFRPIELAGKLTTEIAAAKWAETLDLITSYHMSNDDITTAFLTIAKLRDGAKDLFAVCEQYNIPTVILSSGIRNVIKIMSDHYKIKPVYILSNDLIVDTKSNLVTGWRKDTLVHMLNKNEMGHKELTVLRNTRPNVLLIGDVPDDTKMVTGNNVIRIRVLDPREGEARNQATALRSSYDAGYDLTVNQNLFPVVGLMEWLCSDAP